MRVALATCLHLPEPDADADLLVDALERRGISARWLGWDDPDARFDDAELVVLRSTWNYHHRREAFLAFVDSLGARVLNSPATVRWSSHKSYLRDLEWRGIPVVPTLFLQPGQVREVRDLTTLLDERGWTDVVAKPAVSAGSFATFRIKPETPAAPELFAMLAEREAMVQPYMASVDDHGERSLVYIDGALTHAIRKSPRFAGGHEEVSAAVPIAADERSLAERILAGIDDTLLYARVDLARDPAGDPCVMELELVEPSLFLAQFPPALERLVEAIARRLSTPA